MKTMTKEQAIAEGYEYAGFKDVGWQNYSEISDLDDEDIKRGSYFLAEKEKQYPAISNEQLFDIILDDIDCHWCDETGCDDSTVSDALHGIDLTAITSKINERLSVIWSSKITDIQLIN